MLNNTGFGSNKDEAIKLLQTTINILNEFKVTHFLISGTLLGYIRHNDFIPWDDDIDLLVDEDIIGKLDDILKKYKNINIFKKNDKYDSIKICFSEGIEIPNNKRVEEWKKNSISESNKYCWPYVDLFIYECGPSIHSCAKEPKEAKIGNINVKIFDPFSGECSECFRLFTESEISFFHNEWNKDQFFPPKKVNFLGVECNIPNNSDYFLGINYGPDYMTELKKSKSIHKIEQIHND